MSYLGNIKNRIKGVSNDIQKSIVEDFIALTDAPKVSEEEFEKRIALCESCEHFDSETRRCKICTCFMDIKCTLEEYPFVFGGKDKKVKCSDSVNTKW